MMISRVRVQCSSTNIYILGNHTRLWEERWKFYYRVTLAYFPTTQVLVTQVNYLGLKKMSRLTVVSYKYISGLTAVTGTKQGVLETYRQTISCRHHSGEWWKLTRVKYMGSLKTDIIPSHGICAQSLQP